MYQQDITKIGGEGLTIEIDETLMSRRKYHRGRILSEKWIFGGLCRETGENFAYLVPDRKGETLLEIIQQNVLPGTIIHTDQWAGYNILDQLPFPQQYVHYSVNHSKNFVDPITHVHTQKIERLWREIKRIKHKYNGLLRKDVDLHLAEFLWRRKNQNNPFDSTLKLLRDTKYS